MSADQALILCATDFGRHAVEAATVAAKIALQRGARLRLVHVTDRPTASVKEILSNRLDREVKRLQKNGVEVEALLVTEDQPMEAFLKYIHQQVPSLIVVGCDVKGPVDRWALGSFSERIAQSSPVPTLVVRDPSVFEDWDWTKGRLRILLALDFYSSSDVVLRWAKEFRIAGPCDLIACHVSWRMPASEPSTRAAGGPETGIATQHRLERDLRKKVRDQIGDDAMETVIRFHGGLPGSCIVEVANERKAHVVAIGAHQRHGLQRVAQFSVSREVLHQSGLNVICVPVVAHFDTREAHIPDFRRVLVATDFSELGNAAIPFAAGACSIGGLVKVVHVALPRSPAKRRAHTGWASDLRADLQSLIPHEVETRRLRAEVEVLEDVDVARALCAEADRFGADLVCMASHGFGVSRAIHGSVTKGVLKRLRRPLLVLRRPED